MKQETLTEALEMAASICAAKTLRKNEVGKNAAVNARAMYVCKECFKYGAAWQRNHVWHKNTEMPSDEVSEDDFGKSCLVKKGDNIFIGYAFRSTIGKYYFTDKADIWHQISSIDCWAYLSDLLPTSFDDILESNKDVLQRLKKGETK